MVRLPTKLLPENDGAVPSTILYDPNSNDLVLDSGHRLHGSGRASEYQISHKEAAKVLASDLRCALLQSIDHNGGYIEAACLVVHSPAVRSIPRRRMDTYYREQELDYFLITTSETLVMMVTVDNPITHEDAEVERLLGDALSYRGVVIENIRWCLGGLTEPDAVEVTLEFPPDWRIKTACDLARIIRYMLGHPGADTGSPLGAYILLLAGHGDALLGHAESDWLEVKQKGYGFEDEGKKHEFALDVAALANTTAGGVIVVGMRTERDEFGHDVIVDVCGLREGKLIPGTYLQVARQRIVPAIDGLEVRLLKRQDRELLVIWIPSQDEWLKPFIVRGGMTGNNRVSGAAFTIVHRVGDSRWPTSAEAVHSLLVAARAALRSTGPDSMPPKE